MAKNSDKFRKWPYILAAAVSALIVLGFYIFWFGIERQYSFGEPDHWGQFGDYVGGVLNPILAFITIFILVLTLHAQRQELALTRSHVRTEHLLGFAKTLFDSIESDLGPETKIKVGIPITVGPKWTWRELVDIPSKRLFDIDAVPDNRIIAGRAKLEATMRDDGTTDEWSVQMLGTLGSVRSNLIELNGIIAKLRVEQDGEQAASYYVRRVRSAACAALVNGYLKVSEIPELVPEKMFYQRVKQGYRVWKKGDDGEFKSGPTIQEAVGQA